MISTEHPMTQALRDRLKELQGEPVASDEKHALYDKLQPMTQREGGDLARAQGEPVTLTLPERGEVVTFTDGRMYQATALGWIRVDPERPTTTRGESDHG